jgi:hypothetical protein
MVATHGSEASVLMAQPSGAATELTIAPVAASMT